MRVLDRLAALPRHDELAARERDRQRIGAASCGVGDARALTVGLGRTRQLPSGAGPRNGMPQQPPTSMPSSLRPSSTAVDLPTAGQDLADRTGETLFGTTGKLLDDVQVTTHRGRVLLLTRVVYISSNSKITETNADQPSLPSRWRM